MLSRRQVLADALSRLVGLPSRVVLEYSAVHFGEVVYFCKLSEFDEAKASYVWRVTGIGSTAIQARQLVEMVL